MIELSQSYARAGVQLLARVISGRVESFEGRRETWAGVVGGVEEPGWWLWNIFNRLVSEEDYATH